MSVMGCFVVGCNRLFEDESIAHIFLTCKCMRIRKLAEGVVSAPFLPSGDQGRKGGFAPLPKQHPIACRITNEIPHKDKPFSRSIGRKTWREHGHTQELANGSNQAKQTVLAGTSRIA